MSYARFALFKLTLCRALLIAALPSACAVGVTPSEDTGDTSDPVASAGASVGGMLGSSGSGSVLPKAGTTSTGGSSVVSPFGGSASTAGSSSGGQSSAGAGGSGHGGSAGASGSGAGGSAGAGGGSVGTGGTGSGCACATTVTWTDNHVLAWKTGDCVDVAGTKYLYVGTIAQTYANGQCNPAKQETWCTDSGNDYKFMLCK